MSDAGLNWFIKRCARLPDLLELPQQAYLGDVCKHQGKYWVYMYDCVWTPLDEALKIEYEVQP